MRWMLAVGVALACAGGAAGAARMAPGAAPEAPVPMSVRGVGHYQGQWVVLLEDAAHRRLPIWIGETEANAIDMRLKKLKPARPLTHDLLEEILVTLGVHVERVEVSDLRDNVFYGRLTLRDAKGGLRVLDARPSDCIALAAGAGLPVLVAPAVLRAAATNP